ncbi:MAG: hypothetical protein JSU69_00980, partial [Candidatus Zixiibacteriota bacterium]
MVSWKGRLDSKTSALLAKAAKSQLQFGLGEMVISRKGVEKKKKELVLSGRKKKRASHFKSLASHEKAICNCRNCSLGATRT